MKKEDRKLLLKDLCARLPYNVRVLRTWIGVRDGIFHKKVSTLKLWDIEALSNDSKIHIDDLGWITIKGYKLLPYLRPMSSMTDEEKDEFINLRYRISLGVNIDLSIHRYLDFLYSHHIDIDNRLLHKDLAIEVTEDNNPYKE